MVHTESLQKPNKIETAERNVVAPESLNSTEQELPLARALGAQVYASVQGLWNLYPDRRHGSVIHVGRRIVEIEGVAMRDYGEHYLEETVLRSRVYNASSKSEFDPLDQVSVYIKTEDGEELITVDALGDADVRYRGNADESEDWQAMPFQRAVRIIEELSHRALVAEVRHGSRTPAEKAVADTQATELLRERFPLLGKPETSLE